MAEVKKWKIVSQTNVSATERLTEPWWEAREMLYESLLSLFKISTGFHEIKTFFLRPVMDH